MIIKKRVIPKKKKRHLKVRASFTSTDVPNTIKGNSDKRIVTSPAQNLMQTQRFLLVGVNNYGNFKPNDLFRSWLHTWLRRGNLIFLAKVLRGIENQFYARYFEILSKVEEERLASALNDQLKLDNESVKEGVVDESERVEDIKEDKDVYDMILYKNVEDDSDALNIFERVFDKGLGVSHSSPTQDIFEVFCLTSPDMAGYQIDEAVVDNHIFEDAVTVVSLASFYEAQVHGETVLTKLASGNTGTRSASDSAYLPGTPSSEDLSGIFWDLILGGLFEKWFYRLNYKSNVPKLIMFSLNQNTGQLNLLNKVGNLLLRQPPISLLKIIEPKLLITFELKFCLLNRRLRKILGPDRKYKQTFSYIPIFKQHKATARFVNYFIRFSPLHSYEKKLRQLLFDTIFKPTESSLLLARAKQQILVLAKLSR